MPSTAVAVKPATTSTRQSRPFTGHRPEVEVEASVGSFRAHGGGGFLGGRVGLAETGPEKA
jgi:hypothetical protein